MFARLERILIPPISWVLKIQYFDKIIYKKIQYFEEIIYNYIQYFEEIIYICVYMSA